MDNNKISIIIPAYNIEQYIAATLDSVLAQSYSNFEVIVVDDGSKDGTGAIIDAYALKDFRVRAIHQANGGVTAARLHGVAEASGDWIGFVDGDDYVEPQMYERLLENALSYNAEISHCGYQMVFPNGRIDYYYNTGRLVKQDKISGLKDLISGSFIEPGLCNKLFHKTLLRSLLHGDRLPKDIKINEDLLMNFYLFRMANRSVFEDICPYHYILRKGSAANAKLNANQLLHPLRVKKILFMETEGENDLHAICGNHLVRQLVTLSTMNPKQDPELIIPVQRQARKELRQMLGTVLLSNLYSKKIKIMALWAVLLPVSYRWVHTLYSIAAGTDNIYEK